MADGLVPEVRPDGVGPEDVLEVDIHLKSWDTVVALGDSGAVTKRILRPSSGSCLPRLGAAARAALTGRLPDGTLFEEHSYGDPLRITIGAGAARVAHRACLATASVHQQPSWRSGLAAGTDWILCPVLQRMLWRVWTLRWPA